MLVDSNFSTSEPTLLSHSVSRTSEWIEQINHLSPLGQCPLLCIRDISFLHSAYGTFTPPLFILDTSTITLHTDQSLPSTCIQDIYSPNLHMGHFLLHPSDETVNPPPCIRDTSSPTIHTGHFLPHPVYGTLSSPPCMRGTSFPPCYGTFSRHPACGTLPRPTLHTGALPPSAGMKNILYVGGAGSNSRQFRQRGFE